MSLQDGTMVISKMFRLLKKIKTERAVRLGEQLVYTNYQSIKSYN